MGQFEVYNARLFSTARAFGRAQELQLQRERENRGWERGNTCQTTASPGSNNKSLFCGKKEHPLSPEAATLTSGTHSGAGRVIAPTRAEQPVFLPLLSPTSSVLGLWLMQARAGHYQQLSGKLAGNEFSSENKADIFQFSVWPKRRKCSIWREYQLSWGTSSFISADTGQQSASFGSTAS